MQTKGSVVMAGDTEATAASDATCFVCDDQLSHAAIPLSIGLTASSQTELPTKISQVMGDGFIVVCSTDDKICTRCSMLLNQFDKLETDLAVIHEALTGYLNKKYNLLQIPVTQIEAEEEAAPITIQDAEEAPDMAVENDLQENISQEDAEEDCTVQDFNDQEDPLATTQDEANNTNPNGTINIALEEPSPAPKNSNWYKCNRCDFHSSYFREIAAHKTKCQKLDVHCSMCDARFANQKQLRGHVIAQHLTRWPCHFCGLSFTDQREFTTHVSAHLQSLNGTSEMVAVDPQDGVEDEFVEVVDVLGGEDGTVDLDVAENSPYVEIDRNVEVGDEIAVVLNLEDQQGLENGQQWGARQDKDKLALIWGGLDEVEASDDADKDLLQCLACSMTFDSEVTLKRHLRTHARTYEISKPSEDSEGTEDDDLETLIGKMRARDPILPDDITWDQADQVEVEGSERSSDRVADMQQLIRAKKLSSADAADNADLVTELGPSETLETQPKAKTKGSLTGTTCATCGLELPTTRALRTHRLTHATGTANVCDVCGLSFPRQRQLAEHVAQTHRDPHCRFCGKEILKAKTLRSHEQRHLRGGQRSFDCKSCERVFKTATGLRHHTAVHTGEYKYCCDFCGRGFVSRMMMEEHRVRHTKEERYVCDICGKKFSFQSTYWIHRKWHDTPMPYKCPFCGRLFKHSSLLAVHRRKHTGERPYKCPHCPLSFPVGGTLKRHLILHTGVYPFICQSCKRGFTTKHKYLQHLQKAHQMVVDLKPPKTELRMTIRDTPNDPSGAEGADTLLDWEMADDSTFMLMDGGTEMGEIILEDSMIPCHVVANGDDQEQMVQIVLDDGHSAGDEAGSLIADLWPTYSVG